MHIVLRSVRSRKKSTEKKHSTSSHHTCWWFIPRLFSKVFVSENQFEPGDFLKMRKNTHIQSNNLAACARERQRLWLDWICDREMRPARKQQRRLIGRQMELSLFPLSFLKLFLYFSAQYNKESVHLTYLCPIFWLKKNKMKRWLQSMCDEKHH